MAGLLYRTGLRLMECVRLRVKDIDFGHRAITVRAGKENKDRTTPMPAKSSVRWIMFLEKWLRVPWRLSMAANSARILIPMQYIILMKRRDCLCLNVIVKINVNVYIVR